jgi:tetratricopeptide (TPR) repeat protein
MSNFIDFDAWWNYQQPAQTAEKFAALLQQWAAGEKNEQYVCLLTQLARTQSLQRNFTEAHHYLDQAAELMTDAMPLAKVRYGLERGRTFNSAQQKEPAIPLFEMAYQTALSINETAFAVDAAHMLAIAMPSTEQQLAWNHIAIDLAESSTDPKAQQWLGSLYNNTAWTHFDMGDYERALSIFETALQWRQDNHHSESTIFVARWSVARCLRALLRTQEALAIQQSLCEEMTQHAQPDGYVYEELAECWAALGDKATARPYYQLAHQYLSQDAYLTMHEAERIQNLWQKSQETSD